MLEEGSESPYLNPPEPIPSPQDLADEREHADKSMKPEHPKDLNPLESTQANPPSKS